LLWLLKFVTFFSSHSVKISKSLPLRSIASPVPAWLFLAGALFGGFYTLLLVLGLVAGVLAVSVTAIVP
jgi:hypothetical protein